jgi:predicted dienelactone hydrolase
VKLHRIATLAGVALAWACGDDGDAGTTPTPEEPGRLFARGPYPIGFIADSVTYASPLSGEDRTIPVRVWYPADEDSPVGPAHYVLGELGQLESAALDAPPVSPDGPFPVVVYSHGSGSDGVFAYPFAEHLASHGFIFVAPNHVGNTTSDRIRRAETSRARSLAIRPYDVSASLDWLERDAALGGAADIDGAMMIGYSRGGATALMVAGGALRVDALLDACEEDCEDYEDEAIAAALETSRPDPRIGAVVAQAPAAVLEFDADTLAELDTPTMLMTGDLDSRTPDAGAAWDLLDGADDVWIRLRRGAHLSFLTICLDLRLVLFGGLPPGAESEGCGPEFIPADYAVELQQGYVLAYALRHELGEAEWEAILQPPALDDELEVVAR